jgi:hypothetical protein
MAELSALEAALVKADAAGNTEDARALAAAIREARAAPPAQASQRDVRFSEKTLPPERSNWFGPLEAVGHLASGSVAAPLSGLAGLVGALMPGPEGQGGDYVNRVGNALTFQPKSTVGQKIVDVLNIPFEYLHKGAQRVGQMTQDEGAPPAVAAGVQTGIEALPLALMARGKTAASAAAESRNTVRDATYKAARTEGYVFPPSATGAGIGNAAVEGISARSMLNQDMILKNQQTTNKIARREVGLPEDKAITVGALEGRRQQLAAPYREASAIDPIVAQDVQALRQARADASGWYKAYDHTPNPLYEKKAKRFEQRAEQLEQFIEQAAQQAGKPDLMDRIRVARREIAKTYDVQRALNLGTGDVSASVFGSLLDKGRPLTGGLETIGRAHQAFSPYMRDGAGIANPGVGRTHSALGVGGGPSGMHGGVGLLTSGIPIASGAARGMVGSNWYQNVVGAPQYTSLGQSSGTLAALLAEIQQAEEARK